MGNWMDYIRLLWFYDRFVVVQKVTIIYTVVANRPRIFYVSEISIIDVLIYILSVINILLFILLSFMGVSEEIGKIIKKLWILVLHKYFLKT